MSAVVKQSAGAIESRLPRAAYDAIDAINISRLKNLRRSGLHYQYALTHPYESAALTLGVATHVAVLEPERFETEFAIWANRTEAGKMSPRSGKVWDAFKASHAARTILTADEAADAQAIAAAVRGDATAMKYLESGDPEVSMQWDIEGRACKGRIDWLTTIEGVPYIVGLKTTRDCRHFAFGAQAAKLEYGMQWAYYHDGFWAITGKQPRMIEIVVESDAPYAVATYRIEDDILLQGRDNYLQLLKTLAECEAAGEWPGPELGEQILTLPSWYYPTDDDMSDLGLQAIA